VAGAVLLELEDVVKDFPVRRGLFPGRREDRVHAVDGVSLQVRRGETLGLVGAHPHLGPGGLRRA
jgi:ABC-type glutathione transport system ATPase component